MSLFAFLAYLSPLLAGFGVAAALALAWPGGVRRRLAAALGVAGGVVVLLALAAIGDSFKAFGPVALLAGGVSGLVAGVFCFCAAFRLPPEVCQIAASLVVVALVGSVFLMGPVLENAEEVGMPGEEISRRITLAVGVNPMMVMGYSVFADRDLVREPGLYDLGLADYPFVTPEWGRTALGYVVTGFMLFAAAMGLTALRLRFARSA
jgi:hypothetical protein